MTGRLVVMASGAGTNLGAILDAIAGGRLDAGVAAVITNRRGAGARLVAERAGVPVHYRPLSHPAERRRYDAALAELAVRAEPDLVVLAGWMHLLSSTFLDRFPNRVINLHPALPGRFPGADAIADAWEAYQAGRITRTGAMVHYVPDEGVDDGPPVASVEVPIGSGDTFEALCQRIHEAEHDLIVSAIAEILTVQAAHDPYTTV